MSEQQINIEQNNTSKEPGHGGDVVFSAGSKWADDPTGLAVDGSIIFKRPNGDELFRLDQNGDVAVRGDVVTQDLAMYQAFAEWLEHASVKYTKP
jgi:hypothetical protein